MTTEQDYHQAVISAFRRNPEWRTGQAYFNALFQVRPDLANRARGDVSLDTFYRDDNIPTLLNWVAEHWEDQ